MKNLPGHSLCHLPIYREKQQNLEPLWNVSDCTNVNKCSCGAANHTTKRITSGECGEPPPVMQHADFILVTEETMNGCAKTDKYIARIRTTSRSKITEDGKRNTMEMLQCATLCRNVTISHWLHHLPIQPDWPKKYNNHYTTFFIAVRAVDISEFFHESVSGLYRACWRAI